MPTATLSSHTLRCRLAATAVDIAAGVIRGCTVAKSGVQATGKFVWLDAKGEITADEDAMKSEVPIFTDETTLTTLMAAAKVAGKRIKVREDHADEIGARAGYADAFIQAGDRVSADVHLFKSYRNRETVLETADQTPEEIGLSIDIEPTFELKDDRALMRVKVLNAVDVVDRGALTPDGLLLSARVDTARKSDAPEILTPVKMAATSPTIDELNASIAKTNEGYAALSSQVANITAALAKLTAPPATPAAAAPAPDAAMAAVNEVKTQLAAMNEKLTQMKKEKALLGFRGSSDERAKLASATVEEIEKAASEKKNYLQLVAERAESAKCKKSEAHVWVMKNHAAEYKSHLVYKGIVKDADIAA